MLLFEHLNGRYCTTRYKTVNKETHNISTRSNHFKCSKLDDEVVEIKPSSWNTNEKMHIYWVCKRTLCILNWARSSFHLLLLFLQWRIQANTDPHNYFPAKMWPTWCHSQVFQAHLKIDCDNRKRFVYWKHGPYFCQSFWIKERKTYKGFIQTNQFAALFGTYTKRIEDVRAFLTDSSCSKIHCSLYLLFAAQQNIQSFSLLKTKHVCTQGKKSTF